MRRKEKKCKNYQLPKKKEKTSYGCVVSLAKLLPTLCPVLTVAWVPQGTVTLVSGLHSALVPAPSPSCMLCHAAPPLRCVLGYAPLLLSCVLCHAAPPLS